MSVMTKEEKRQLFLSVKDAWHSSSSSPPYTQASQSVLLNFVPKTRSAESQLASLTTMSAYKLPRKKRALQPSNDQSFGDDEEDDDFKRKKHQWLDGMLHLNEQQRVINDMKIQKLQKELAEGNGDNKPKEVVAYDEYGYAMNHI